MNFITSLVALCIIMYHTMSFSSEMVGCNRPEISNELVFPLIKNEDAVRILSYNIRGESAIDHEQGNSWDIRK